jgi:hypothetical protein
MNNANANTNAQRGIKLYTWNGTDYSPTLYKTKDELQDAVKKAKGDDFDIIYDMKLITEVFNKYNCLYPYNTNNLNQNFYGEESTADDEITANNFEISVLKYYISEKKYNNSIEFNNYIKENITSNNYYLLDKESEKIDPRDFLKRYNSNVLNNFEQSKNNEQPRIKEDTGFGFMKNSIISKIFDNNKNNNKDTLLSKYTKLINIFNSNNETPFFYGDGEKSTVVNYNSNPEQLSEGLKLGDVGDSFKKEVTTAVELLNKEIKKYRDCNYNLEDNDRTLKLNFFNCNIVNDIDIDNVVVNENRISLNKLMKELNNVFNPTVDETDVVDTSELANILIILNGNPGVIPDNNNNNLETIASKIKNKIDGKNVSSSKIEIEMDKYMDGRVKHLARLYNNTKGGGSKKRSRPNKRVKTKKAKAKATRKKQNKRLKKNKTLKKKNRRA